MRSVLISLFLLSSVSVYAQGYRPYRYERYERSGSIAGRVQADLSRAASNPYLSRGDRHRIDNAIRELGDFQERWSRGRFDRGELNEAIGKLQSAVNARSLPYQDREILAADLAQLREFRARETGYR
jgi:hypothetical protein